MTGILHRSMTPVLQTADSDCAPACLAMILRHLGLRVGLPEVRERIDPGRDGSTAGDLRDVARMYGVRTRAIRINPADRGSAGTPLPTPFVAHWDNNHFVVVTKDGRRTVELIDPAVGRRRLTAAEFAEHASGVVLLFTRGSDAADVAVPPRPAPIGSYRSILRPLVARHRGRMLLTILLSLLLAVVGLAVPGATAVITNDLAAGQDPSRVWLVLVPVLAVAMGAMALIRGLGAATLSYGLSRDLTGTVAHRMFGSAYRYFERRSTGDLFMRIASADMVRELLGVALVGSVMDAVLATGYLTVLLWLDPFLAAVTAGALGCQLLVVLMLTARARTQHREELLAGADGDSLIVDAIAGIASIRTCGAEGTILRRWAGYVELRLRAATRRSRTAAVVEAVTTTSQFAAPILFLLVAAANSASPGAALGLAALAVAVLAPLTSLSTRLIGLAELGPLLDRISDVMTAPRERGEDAAVPATGISGRIELAGAGFRYDTRSPFVFRGLDLDIAAGMKVAVVGPSGCGKSTLLSVLTGLHELTEGQVLFDGRDIATMNLPSLRRQIGVVLQDTYVGIGTLRDAITLGRSDVPDQEVCRVAQMADILDEIDSMPMGFDTRVSEGGRGISGGQRQRIALARALLGSPSVLILDEATSALDAETEARIERNLRGLRMTRIVIAHRLSTVADADLVLVLNAGRIVEAGSPAELRQLGGHYAAMVAVQEDVSTVRQLTMPPVSGSGPRGSTGTGGRHRAADAEQDQGATPVRQDAGLAEHRHVQRGARHLAKGSSAGEMSECLDDVAA